MKIVIAPDSFKETLSASEAANAIEAGFLEFFPNAEILKLPIADGGEGTVDVLVSATEGSYFSTNVSGPMGEVISARWGMLGDTKTAAIEVAEACGLHLVSVEKRNPMLASSHGVGELILAAVDEGAEHIIIGLGGSSSNDGGMGFLQAIGVRFLDILGNQLRGDLSSLSSLSDIDLSYIDPRLKGISFEVACDVDNPLVGSQGASAIFASQKGADSEMIDQLEIILNHYSSVISRKFNNDVSLHPGAGAAGGIGYGFKAFLNAELKSGIKIILDKVDFNQHLLNADLVLTGEGKIDSQSDRGKAPIGVIEYAKRHKCRIFIIAGILENSDTLISNYGIDKAFSVVSSKLSIEEAMASPFESLMAISREAAQHYKKYYSDS
jgi:glycerate kinase